MQYVNRLLCKADLCHIFGEYSRKTGKCYYEKLRRDYFTDEVLEALQITVARWRQITGGRRFSYPESQRIIAYFEIQAEEMAEPLPKLA